MSNKFPCQVTTLPENLEIIIMYQTNVVQSYVLLLLLLCMLLMYLPALLRSIYDSQFNFLLHLHHVSDKIIILDNFNFLDIDWDNTLSGNSPVLNQFCDLVF